MNSLVGNAPLMIGPAIAGILIATVGIYASFFIQAMTQWLVVIAVAFMRPSPLSPASPEPMLRQILTGIRFVAADPILRWITLLMIVLCVCLRPYSWLLAGFAGHVLHVDAKTYGLMLTMGGLGTIGGAFTTTVYQTEHRARIMFAAAFTAGIAILVLSATRDLPFVMLLLMAAGWGTMVAQTSGQVMLQTFSPQEIRGRSMALYSIIAIGVTPLGSLWIGALGSALTLPVGYAVGAVVALSFFSWVWISHPRMRVA